MNRRTLGRLISIISLVLPSVLNAEPNKFDLSFSSKGEATISGDCGKANFHVQAKGSTPLLFMSFDHHDGSLILPSDDSEGPVQLSWLACAVGPPGHFLVVQFDDKSHACSKCSVVDIYDSSGSLLSEPWQKIYLKYDLVDLFNFTIGDQK